MSDLPPPDPADQTGQWQTGPPQQPPQPGAPAPPQQPGQWQQTPPGNQAPAVPYSPSAVMGNPYEDQATPILITGILSLVVCGPIGIYAWIKGNSLRDTAQAAGWPEPSTARVGRILGIVGTVIGILQVGFGILWVLIVFGIMGAAATGY